jgi:hypothetical protein
LSLISHSFWADWLLSRDFGLMAAMSQRPRYQFPAETGGPGRFFFWLFLLLVLGIIGFVWWHSRKPAPKAVAPRRPIVTTVTNAPEAAPRPEIVAQTSSPPLTNQVMPLEPVMHSWRTVI